jgi:hemerythrin-like metal-binding protein
MAFVEWTSELATGVDELDIQHRRLLEQINELHEAREAGQDEDICRTIFAELLSALGEHFASEEGHMTAFEYPRGEEHVQAHVDLLGEVHQLRASACDDGGPVGDTIFHALEEGLTEHIIEHDGPLGEFLLAHHAERHL